MLLVIFDIPKTVTKGKTKKKSLIFFILKKLLGPSDDRGVPFQTMFNQLNLPQIICIVGTSQLEQNASKLNFMS